MANLVEVKVPDIGDFADVEVIEVLVAAGDQVNEEDPLITLETDKATMEVPSSHSGTVKDLQVSVGDRVSEGTVVLKIEAGEAAPPVEPPSPAGVQESDAEPPAPPPAKEDDTPRAAPPAAVSAASATPASGRAPVDEAGFAKAHASPSVRAFARELGADLGRVTGSGPKGRIVF